MELQQEARCEDCNAPVNLPRRGRQPKRCPPCAEERNRVRSRNRARAADYAVGTDAWRISAANNVMARARREKVPCDPAAVMDTLRAMATTCPIFGTPFEVRRGQCGPSAASPTVDRFVPAKGYIRGNMAVISWRANRLKCDGTPAELMAVAAWMAVHPYST